jgi:hypothetical protein
MTKIIAKKERSVKRERIVNVFSVVSILTHTEFWF